MLWTDASAREFLAEHYEWFLSTFDAYTYPIQRADALRYFVLHYYGGVYIDLDIGCRAPLDPLLTFPVILPKTIPVGISNDLMFAEKGHPFMDQTIHNLLTFDHSLILNYPTVMFSTGPMFLSAQYGLYTSAHPPTPSNPGGDVRVLPKSFYGKNAKPGEAPNSFFTHHYGSSWHADDAAFITFLGKWGKLLMRIGAVILVLGVLRLLFQKRKKSPRRERSRRRFTLGRYDVVLPRAFQRDGRFHLDLGFNMQDPSTEPSSPLSSMSSEPSSPSLEHPLLPLTLTPRSGSPISSQAEMEPPSFVTRVGHAWRQAGVWVWASLNGPSDTRRPRRRNRSRGVMYFLPAIFTPASRHTVEHQHLEVFTAGSGRRLSSRSESPTTMKRELAEAEAAAEAAAARNGEGSSSVNMPPPPPPYEHPGAGRRQNSLAFGSDRWAEWVQTP
ncbi:glycosyltransferase family 32 protein [Sphaerobolus stellatus SS14]|nr:glycosyltransferase family 32 protein [Sphaerobolus stellatus SS14]